ncbi:hypothetical protein V2J09_023150 [Rumex salicifolius]
MKRMDQHCLGESTKSLESDSSFLYNGLVVGRHDGGNYRPYPPPPTPPPPPPSVTHQTRGWSKRLLRPTRRTHRSPRWWQLARRTHRMEKLLGMSASCLLPRQFNVEIPEAGGGTLRGSLGSEKIKIVLPTDGLGIPSMIIEPDLVESLALRWKHSLVIKILGRPIAFQAFERKLREIWRLDGRFSITDLTNGFSVVRFELEDDFNRAFMDGPWTIFSQCLMVRHWTTDFDLDCDTIQSICAWVRISILQFVFYNEGVIRNIVSYIGRPVRVDRNTSNIVRGGFARVCVELDLSKRLQGAILVNGKMVLLEYEGLGEICIGCGKQGHLVQNCSSLGRKDGDGEQVDINTTVGSLEMNKQEESRRRTTGE